MASSYTASLRFNLQAAGDNLNLWGIILNNGVFQLADQAIAGMLTMTLSGNLTLTSANGSSDQARNAMINVTGGTGGVITVPAVTKMYAVKNAASGGVTISAGGTSVTVQSGENTFVFCDGANISRLIPQNFPTPAQSTDVATKGYVDGIAFSVSGALPGITPGTAGMFVTNNGTTASWGSVYPTQTGNGGKALVTDGTSASWGFAGFGGYRSLVANTTVATTDREKLLDCVGTFNLTFPAASSVPAGFPVYVANNGTGDITYVRTGADTLDGLTGYVGYPGEMRLWLSDGVSAWFSKVLTPFTRTYTASAVFTKPPGYTQFGGLLWGGGGSGSGYPNASGGGGGACVPFTIPASALAATTFTTIAGAAAGVGVNTLGVVGGNSVFGTITAYGGGGGLGVGAPGPLAGAGGGGALGVASGATGGAPTTTGTDQDGFGGANGFAGAAGRSAYGGASAGGVTGGVAFAGGNSIYGGAGGGAIQNSTGAGAAGGTSIFGGAGGAGVFTGNGVNGSAPGGGGGAGTGATKSGDGARGELRIWGIV